MDSLKSKIRSVPDFPKPGINFFDITTLLRDRDGFHSTIDAMVKSRWVYRKLKNFRAGIEANISCLKRAFGLTRCTWRGLDHFKAYVWSSVVAYNLALFVRLRPA